MAQTLRTIIEIVAIGIGIAIIIYWLAILLGKISPDRSYFKWWLKVVVVQGIIVAVGLRLLKWL